MNYFMRFDFWGGNIPIIKMQLEKALQKNIGLELNISSYKQLNDVIHFLKSVHDVQNINVHIPRGGEFSFYFSDDNPKRNRIYVESTTEFFIRSPGRGHVIHDETDPHAETLSESRLNSYIDAFKQLDIQLQKLNKTLYIEFSTALDSKHYLNLMEQISGTGLKLIGSCIDRGHVYYFFRRKKGYTRDKSIESLKQFIIDVKKTGLPMYYHVHDCDPHNPHPWYGVADHKKTGDGEIGIDGFREIISLLKDENLNLEVLPVSDYQKTNLTDEEIQNLINYAVEHNIDTEKQIKDGKIIKQTLEDIVESKNILENLVNESD